MPCCCEVIDDISTVFSVPRIRTEIFVLLLSTFETDHDWRHKNTCIISLSTFMVVIDSHKVTEYKRIKCPKHKSSNNKNTEAATKKLPKSALSYTRKINGKVGNF